MNNPFDTIPPQLTNEAKQDKLLWELAIQSLKGRERRIAFEKFAERYGVLPTPHPLHKPI